MTNLDWREIVEWIAERFPDSQWQPTQITAYWDDLQGHDASDIWSALFAIYESGMTFAPNGSQIIAKVLSLRRDRAERVKYDVPVLPAGKVDELPVGGWLEKWYPDEQVTWEEHIRRVHKKGRPCKSRICDIHHLAKEET